MNHPPVGRRLILSSILFIGGFLISLRGWLDTDYDRRLISSLYAVSGLILSAIGLLLWWAIGFRSSWGWWL